METLEAIHRLRSTHGSFAPDRDVPEADLEKVLQASVRAATASARQSYSIVVVRDRDRIRRLAQYDASVWLLYCLDFARLADLASYLGESFSWKGPTLFLAGCADTFLAAQTAAIAARDLGIDSLFTNSVHRQPPGDLYAEMRLPEEGCFPLTSLLLGYEDTNTPRGRTGRLTGAGIIHRERYARMDDAAKEAIVRLYDDPESCLQTSTAWRSRGFDHYLTWFFRVRSQVSRWDKELADCLNCAGFQGIPDQ